jgi:hypothetical protein
VMHSPLIAPSGNVDLGGAIVVTHLPFTVSARYVFEKERSPCLLLPLLDCKVGEEGACWALFHHPVSRSAAVVVA